MKLVNQGESYGVDSLFAGLEIPHMTKGVKLASGQGILERGSILSLDTNGDYVLIANKADVPEGILTDDIDTDIDTITTMYRQGHFNSEELKFGGDITDISEIAHSLRTINILTTKVE